MEASVARQGGMPQRGPSATPAASAEALTRSTTPDELKPISAHAPTPAVAATGERSASTRGRQSGPRVRPFQFSGKAW